ncbi:MAG: hypothetical protein ACRCSP_07030 [Rhodoglobus sp.]
MSIDDLSDGGARADEHQSFSFHRISLGLIIVLAVLASGLGVINANQGPRISSVEMNQQALIARSGQRVVVRVNQPLNDISLDQLEISPTTEVSEVTVDQNTVTLKFAPILDYATDYAVRIGVRSAVTGIEAKLDFTLSTPDIDILSLQRETVQDSNGLDQPDRILRSTFSGTTAPDTVFEGPRIQEYALLRDLLAVVTLGDDDTPKLTLTPPSGGAQTSVDLGAAKTIRELRAASTGDIFGYILDAGYRAVGPRNTLYLYDLTTAGGVPTPVVGFGGAPLSVLSWTFVPGTTSLVAQGEDNQLYLINPFADGDPTPLGQHDEIRGFIPGTASLVVANPLSGSIIDLKTGTTVVLDLPEPQVSEDLYPGKLIVLGQDSYVQQYAKVNLEVPGDELTSVLVYTGPTGSRELYRTSTPGSSIRDYCLSPNRQYLAVEIISNEGIPDNYPIVYGYSASSTIFVRLADGTSTRGISGFLPDWCR